MKFSAQITVMPLKALLDPQGKAVTSRLQSIGMKEVENVRIGKNITLEIEAVDKKAAEEKIDKACQSLLHNPIMESYEFTIQEIKK